MNTGASAVPMSAFGAKRSQMHLYIAYGEKRLYITAAQAN